MALGKTFIRQDIQIAPSLNTVDGYDDTKTVGSTMESAPVNINDDLNNLRSQLKRWLWADGAGDWFDDVPTHNSKKRGINGVAEHLDELEEQPFLFRSQILVDVPIALADAIALLNEIKVDYEAHRVLTAGSVHGAADSTNVVTAVNATTLASAITLANDIKTQYEAHRVLTAGAVHGAADAIDVVTAANATDMSSLVTLANDLRTQYEAHRVLTTGSVHGAADATNVVTIGVVGEDDDFVILSVAASEAPSETAAVGSVDTTGAVVAYNATFGTADLAEVTGPDALHPLNLCIIRDVTTKEPIMSSNGYEIFGLLQSESNVDGHTFDDASNQVMISFVEQNDAGTDLILTAGADIGDHSINYSYVRQIALDSIPKWAWLTGAFLDPSASTDVTLSRAIANQTGLANQSKDIDWNIVDTYTFAFTSDTGGTNLFSLSADAGGDTGQFTLKTLTLTLTDDLVVTQGAKFDTGGTEIDIGVNAGVIESTGTDDLTIKGAGELLIDDGNRVGSTWAASMKFSDTQAEWDALEVAYGSEKSLIAMLTEAKTSTGTRSKVQAVVTVDVAVDTDINGPSYAANLDTDLPAYNNVTFVDDVEVFLNGELETLSAASATASFYPGTTPAQGDLKSKKALRTHAVFPDQLTVIVNGQ